jgi:hypothetical protein
MPKVRLLVPVGEHAAGAEIDVSDEEFAELRGAGKASSIEEELAAEERAKEGNYGARMTRDDAGGATSEKAAEPPAEEPPPKAKK